MASVDLKVKDVMSEKFYSIPEYERLSKAIGVMKEHNVKALIVTDKEGNYKGVISEKFIRRSYADPETTRVKSFMVHAPKQLSPEDDVYKAAYYLFNANLPMIPVFDDGKVVGVVEIKSLISSYAEADKEYANKKVIDVATTNVLTILPSDPVGKALRLFKENNITRLPVIDEQGKLEGIITLHDIIEKLYHPKTRSQKSKTHVNVAKEKIHVIEYPVKEVMNSVVYSIDAYQTLKDAIEAMVNYNVSSLVVLDEDVVAGIVADKDLLEVIAAEYVEPDHFKVLYSLAGDVKDLDEAELEKAVEHVKDFFEKFADYLGSGNIYIYIKEHEEKFRGVPLYHVRLRASTEKGLFVATGETWGLYNAIGNALHKIRREIEYKSALDKDPYLGLKYLLKEVADTTVLPRIKGVEREF